MLGQILDGVNIGRGRQEGQSLEMRASGIAGIDSERQLLATEKGLFVRERSSGVLSSYCELEPNTPSNRSNDGRVHPSGSLWIGTMSKNGEIGAGAIYHVARGEVTRIFAGISIPNSICFSPEIGSATCRERVGQY